MKIINWTAIFCSDENNFGELFVEGRSVLRFVPKFRFMKPATHGFGSLNLVSSDSLADNRDFFIGKFNLSLEDIPKVVTGIGRMDNKLIIQLYDAFNQRHFQKVISCPQHLQDLEGCPKCNESTDPEDIKNYGICFDCELDEFESGERDGYDEKEGENDQVDSNRQFSSWGNFVGVVTKNATYDRVILCPNPSKPNGHLLESSNGYVAEVDTVDLISVDGNDLWK